MKKTFFILAMLALLVTVNNTAIAKEHEKDNGSKSQGQPFQTIWKAITDLQKQVKNGTGGAPGPVGPAGPVGPQGARGISGAGTIAFIDSDLNATSTVYALTTSGQVWSESTGGWSNINRPVPTSTTAIVQWHLNSFLDQAGMIWRWNGSNWINTSHP